MQSLIRQLPSFLGWLLGVKTNQHDTDHQSCGIFAAVSIMVLSLATVKHPRIRPVMDERFFLLFTGVRWCSLASLRTRKRPEIPS